MSYFNFQPQTVRVGDYVTFDLRGSSDADDDRLEYSWSFGEGSDHAYAVQREDADCFAALDATHGRVQFSSTHTDIFQPFRRGGKR